MKAMVAFLLLTMLITGARAQVRHDPLTDREIDQLRDTAQEPSKRVEYLIGYTRERMLAIERLTGTANQAQIDSEKIGELLGDVAALIDELDDNLTMYNQHSEDLRKPLRHVLDAEADFDKKLKDLEDLSTPLQKRRFAAALADATDSLETSEDSARAMLADQLQKKGEEKGSKTAHAQPALPPQMRQSSPVEPMPAPGRQPNTNAPGPQSPQEQ